MRPCACNGAAQNRVQTGGGAPSAWRVSTTPRAFRVHDPCTPPFGCHALIVTHAGRRAQCGMRKVGCRGRAHRTAHGVVLAPPSLRCVKRRSRRGRGSAVPLQTGVRREEGQRRCSPHAPPPLPAPSANRGGLHQGWQGDNGKGGGRAMEDARSPFLCPLGGTRLGGVRMGGPPPRGLCHHPVHPSLSASGTAPPAPVRPHAHLCAGGGASPSAQGEPPQPHLSGMQEARTASCPARPAHDLE